MSARALKALVVCLAIWCTGGRVRADESGFFQVQVRLRVDRLIRSTGVVAIIEEEAESIWRPYGVQLDWVDLRRDDVAVEGFSVEAVIDRRGDPGVQPDRAVLGRAFVPKDAAGGGPIRVSFDATERMLLRRSSSAHIVGEYDMGRALGRVLAHEIGHVLLGVRHHDDAGLMRAVYTPDELGARDRAPFRLTCNGVGRLRSRIQVMTRGPEAPGEDPDRAPCRLTVVP